MEALLGGFAVVLTPSNLLYCFIGALLGTIVGILPGLGPLTTIAMPLEELGRQAMQLLHRQLIGEPGPAAVTVSDPSPIVIRRASVAAPRH